jgi:hypothetical protein
MFGIPSLTGFENAVGLLKGDYSYIRGFIVFIIGFGRKGSSPIENVG